MGKGYSGHASFKFEIERCKNKQTNQFMTEEEACKEVENHPFGDSWFETNYVYELISLEVEGSSYFTPGRYFGLPENCYPDEGDTEITSVIGPNNEDWEGKLTEDERDQIISMIEEEASSGPDYEPDDYYDDRYDY